MKPAINPDALEALAMIALRKHLSDSELKELDYRCDSAEASDMARALTFLCAGDRADLDHLADDHSVGDVFCHMLGFDFGLLVGAAITATPALQTPDLTEIIELAREQTKHYAKERLPTV